MVEPKDVIDEGMIKKELIINEDIGKIAESEEDSQTAVLEAAYRKRVELKKSFEKEGSDVNPLVLIQIPTAAAGEQKIDAVRKFLSGKDITERKGKIGNGKLAVWLAEEKSELIDWVSEPDNEIEFLVFKQAIDTGWDCPRAHILVKFRETHSIPFEIQIVGRILRMPEQRHFWVTCSPDIQSIYPTFIDYDGFCNMLQALQLFDRVFGDLFDQVFRVA
jgi:type III restriction enzyme